MRGRRSRGTCGQSVAIDPRLVEIHAYEHAIAVFWERDWKAAEQARLKLLRSVAAEVDPQFLRALPLERLALGFPEEAVALARRIGELDPYSPDLATLMPTTSCTPASSTPP